MSDARWLLEYCRDHAARIFVRVEVADEDGRPVWRTLSLAAMPGELALAQAARFIREGRVPVLVPEGDAEP